MFLDYVYPALTGAGHIVHTVNNQLSIVTPPDAFQRLPVNLSPEEIRAMVLEVLG